MRLIILALLVLVQLSTGDLAKCSPGLFNAFGLSHPNLPLLAADPIQQKRNQYTGKNINDYGNYIGCINLEDSHYFVIIPKVNGILFLLGICVPDYCTKEDIEQLFYENIGTGQDDEILVNLPEAKKMGTGGVITIIVFVLFLLFGTLGSYYDIKEAQMKKQQQVEDSRYEPIKQRKSKAIAFFQSFSIVGNLQRIMYVPPANKEKSTTEVLNGIRVLSLCYVVSGHIISFIQTAPLKNFDAFPHEFTHLWLAFAGYGGFYAVDSFFWLSAFLFGFLTSLQYERRNCRFGAMGWVMVYVHRFLRIVPLYMFMMAYYYYIFPHLSSGPIWRLTDAVNRDCDEYWWTNFLFLNNFIPNGTGNDCFGIGWYLANDFQFFAVAPIFLVFYYKFPRHMGWIFGFFIILCSMITTISISAHYQFSTFVYSQWNLQHDYFQKIYFKPYNRIAPYIVGLYAAFIFNEMKKPETKDVFARKIGNLITSSDVMAWIVTILGAVLIVIMIVIQYPAWAEGADHKEAWSNAGNAFFIGTSRFVYSVGLSMFLMPTLLGKCKIVLQFFGHNFFAPFAKIAFGTFLGHVGTMALIYGSLDNAPAFSYSLYIQVYITLLPCCWLFGFVVTLFVENPLANLEKMLFARG